MKQTIGHACGLMALLHIVFNLDGGRYLTPGSTLHDLRNRIIELKPNARAQLLYESKFLEEAHMAAASMGSSAARSPQDDNHHHFIAFVQNGDQVWELNGGMNGPLMRGTLEREKDLLSERGLAMTAQDFPEAAAKGGRSWRDEHRGCGWRGTSSGLTLRESQKRTHIQKPTSLERSKMYLLSICSNSSRASSTASLTAHG